MTIQQTGESMLGFGSGPESDVRKQLNAAIANSIGSAAKAEIIKISKDFDSGKITAEEALRELAVYNVVN